MYSNDVSRGKVKMINSGLKMSSRPADIGDVARRLALLAILCLTALLGVAAGTARAHLVEPYVYDGTFPAGSFNGSDAVGGPAPFENTLRSVDIDQQSGNVYVGHQGGGGLIYKFNSAGQSAPFVALAPNTVISGAPTGLFGETMVDNSQGESQGRIFQWDELGAVIGVLPGGDKMSTGTGFPKFPLAGTGDNCGGDVAPNGNLWITAWNGGIKQYTPSGEPTTDGPAEGFIPALNVCAFAIDSQENFYTAGYNESAVKKFDSSGALVGVVDTGVSEATNIAVDRSTDHVFVDRGSVIKEYTPSGSLVSVFGGAEGGSSYPGLFSSQGLAINWTTHKVYASDNSFPPKIDTFVKSAPKTVPDVEVTAVSVTPNSATLHGTVDPDAANGGSEIATCEFKWGASASNLSNSAPCNPPAPINAPTAVTATLNGLTTGGTYFVQLVATNTDNGLLSNTASREFQPAGPPVISNESASEIHSDSTVLVATIDPHGGRTSYHVEYGTTTGYGEQVPISGGTLASNLGEQDVAETLTGLSANTVYHFRVVATNPNSTTFGPDRTFKTFASEFSLDDPCPNAHVRQQVSAALLPDCRAYELVSAGDTDGYNVESLLAPGEQPFGGYPDASDRVLYGVHSGAVPGPWKATNRGVDPYLAVRGNDGWDTTYVGIPADNPFATGPFSSHVAEADAGLSRIAFDGGDICTPCFADGSTGVPIQEIGTGLVQGMQGSLDPGPEAKSEGWIARRFSEDGSHFVFGSTAQFDEAGNNGTGDISIYDRNLATGQTQVVSTDPAGGKLACLQGPGQCHPPTNPNGIAELDISSDGSRIVLGQLMSTDTAGNPFYHLYMHIGTDPETVDLTPGTVTGVQYAGMSGSGSEVYVVTRDPLATVADQDTDNSADIYRVEVSGTGVTTTRVSIGDSGSGDTDSCDPVGNTQNLHWNGIATEPDCSAVAVSGAGGVAPATGRGIYFLSPEALDTSDPSNLPIVDAPNLYFAAPAESPRFVGTLESDLDAPSPLPTEFNHVSSFVEASAANPQSMAVDQTTGNVYLLSVGAGTKWLGRFDEDGNPVNFTAGPNAGGNKITGLTVAGTGSAQVAVDNSGGPTDGNIYITNTSPGNPVVRMYARDGSELGVLDGSTTPETAFGVGTGSFSFPSGVAVDADGNVYVAGGASNKIYRYVPSGASVTDADYDASLEVSSEPVQIAADSDGNVYVHEFQGELLPGLLKYSSAQFNQPGKQSGAEIDAKSKTAYIDPVDDYIYADDWSTIREYLPNGALHNSFGDGEIGTLSKGVAVFGSDDGGGTRVFAVDTPEKTVHVFQASLTDAAVSRIDNPLVVDSVNAPETRETKDFQVTTTGRFAVFGSSKSLTGSNNGGRTEIFRYDTEQSSLVCASCNPNGALPAGGSYLAANGLSLTDDGSVFFESDDALAFRDLDNRRDIYEWDGSEAGLITTGLSPFDSRLLGASRDGRDIFFFTRDTLVPQDQNGALAKIYDARAQGGFPFRPDPVPCKASDECHGAGSAAPADLRIETVTGAGRSGQPKCRSRFVRRHGRCVRRKKQHHKKANKHRKQSQSRR